MKTGRLFFLALVAVSCGMHAGGRQEAYRETDYAKAPRFKALLYYDDGAEQAHVQFDHQAIAFFQGLTVGGGLPAGFHPEPGRLYPGAAEGVLRDCGAECAALG